MSGDQLRLFDDGAKRRKSRKWQPVPIDERPTSPVIIEGQDEADDQIQKRFLKFHADNPHIYAALVILARQATRRGKRKWSIDVLFGALRFQIQVQVESDEPFKLNNDFRSRYARLLMDQEPDLAGMFEIRILRRSKGIKKKTA
jgi:hypothetical protein